jgi:hypothetical protein
MVLRGCIQNGVVVLDDPVDLPEGTPVNVEVVGLTPAGSQRRRGGQWKGRVQIADDFDQLPDDLAEAFGAREP